MDAKEFCEVGRLVARSAPNRQKSIVINLDGRRHPLPAMRASRWMRASNHCGRVQFCNGACKLNGADGELPT